MSSESVKITAYGPGIGFCGLFFMALFLLKVGVIETEVMEWSWWLITLPLWVMPLFLLGICLCVVTGGGFIGIILMVVEWIRSRWK